MKKKYCEMDLVIIPINKSLEASGDENCIMITQMETSIGSTLRCDLSPDWQIQNEWYGNMKGLPLTYSVADCYPPIYGSPTPVESVVTPEVTVLPEITVIPEPTVIPESTIIPETTGMPE